ncbi:MAG: T9SS type A sorting domain-containing protein [Flavobacteriales bacterium]|nr:T9SS type A sorting domain-containing protein [Flavobacteriales bacterium]MBK9289024.1 T9SS type A sorting domain-containing protein [Flavobacteriales bacterium]
MKRRYSLSLLSLGLVASLNAQTLNDGTTSMQPGQSFLVHYAPYIAPGSAGASQTWNLAALTTDSTALVSYAVPGSTAYYASFSTSTAAQDLGNGDYAYFKGNSSGLELMGVATGGDLIIYQNSERMLQYPCSYLSQWVDAFSADYTLAGIDFSRSGSVSGNADGYGSITMPFGTVSNVLRVKTTEVFSDVTPFGNIDYNYINYNFYKPGVHTPIVTISDLTTTFLGTPTQSQSAVWLDATQVGVQEALRNTIGVEVYPNPADQLVSVVFSADGSEGLTMEVVDLTGKEVFRSSLGTRAPGIQKEVIDISALAAGLYNVRITDSLGGQGIKRLVVQ